MIQKRIACDKCGLQSAPIESNAELRGWFEVSKGVMFSRPSIPLAASTERRQLNISAADFNSIEVWAASAASENAPQHICGEACLHGWVVDNLPKLTAPAQPSTAIDRERGE